MIPTIDSVCEQISQRFVINPKKTHIPEVDSQGFRTIEYFFSTPNDTFDNLYITLLTRSGIQERQVPFTNQSLDISPTAIKLSCTYNGNKQRSYFQTRYKNNGEF